MITIIGILIALLLPAVQAAREAARRLQCLNNLKQIGLALLNYEAGNRVLPQGALANNFHPNFDIWAEATSGGHGTSWMLKILPYMERQNLYARWDFTKDVLGNAAVAATDIPGFYCPSRRSAIRAEDVAIMFQNWMSGGNDYAGCIGYGNAFWDDKDGDFQPPCGHWFSNPSTEIINNTSGKRVLGIFNPFGCTSMADIRDGSSNTILTGEHQRVHGDDGYPAGTSFKCKNTSHDGWAVGGVSTLFDVEFGTLNDGHFEHPGSEHPGGAQFGFADGSVHFLSQSMNAQTLQYLSTYDVGEVVTGWE